MLDYHLRAINPSFVRIVNQSSVPGAFYRCPTVWFHKKCVYFALLTLIVAGVVLWVLGLSLPITATYLVAVPTVIPALTHLGVPPPAAHMFVFYYAVLSEVSPPVALSPFAAAAITGGNPYRTMMLTWKYALPCFLVPFMFTQPTGSRSCGATSPSPTR